MFLRSVHQSGKTHAVFVYSDLVAVTCVNGGCAERRRRALRCLAWLDSNGAHLKRKAESRRASLFTLNPGMQVRREGCLRVGWICTRTAMQGCRDAAGRRGRMTSTLCFIGQSTSISWCCELREYRRDWSYGLRDANRNDREFGYACLMWLWVSRCSFLACLNNHLAFDVARMRPCHHVNPD
jgi:hypothetical protein